MRQLAGTKTRYRRAHAAPLAGLISGRAKYRNLNHDRPLAVRLTRGGFLQLPTATESWKGTTAHRQSYDCQAARFWYGCRLNSNVDRRVNRALVCPIEDRHGVGQVIAVGIIEPQPNPAVMVAVTRIEPKTGETGDTVLELPACYPTNRIGCQPGNSSKQTA